MFKKTVLVLVVVSTLSTAPLLNASPGQRVVPTSQSDEIGIAYLTVGKLNIKSREVQCRQVDPAGKATSLRLLLLFEPRSGAFSWIVTDDLSPADKEVQTNLFKSYRVAFLKDGNLIIFAAQMAPLMLRVQDDRGHASSMDDAEDQALAIVSKMSDPPRNVESARPVHMIPLDRLSPEFVHVPGSEIFGPEPKVVQVQWDGQRWIVILKARWTEAITLDAGYHVVSLKPIN